MASRFVCMVSLACVRGFMSFYNPRKMRSYAQFPVFVLKLFCSILKLLYPLCLSAPDFSPAS